MTNTLPPLPPETYEALKEDIAQHGVLQPVVLDEYGHVLDGHHRRRIAAELGIDCPVRTVAGLSVDEREILGLVLNLHRRQLTPADRREVVRRLRKIHGTAQPGRPKKEKGSHVPPISTPDPVTRAFENPTVPNLAAAFGVHKATIQRDLFDEPKRQRTATDEASTHIRGIVHHVKALKEMGFAHTDPAYHKGWSDDLGEMVTALLAFLQDLVG